MSQIDPIYQDKNKLVCSHTTRQLHKHAYSCIYHRVASYMCVLLHKSNDSFINMLVPADHRVAS